MAQGSGKQEWYLVATKPRQERVAQANLERQGYTTFLPLLHSKKRQRGRWQQVIEPTFPGYVFVAMELGLNAMAPIRSTRGCKELVRFGERPATVPQTIIQVLQQNTQVLSAADSAPESKLTPGDLVMIVEGPFQGLTAIYKMRKGADRVQVLLTLLGRPQLLTVSIYDVSE